MRRFLTENRQDPRAVNVRYMLAEREFAREDYKAAAVEPWPPFSISHTLD